MRGGGGQEEGVTATEYATGHCAAEAAGGEEEDEEYSGQ